MRKRSTTDRRATEDRRKGFNLEIMDRIGMERRVKQRRVSAEKREGWVRVSDWISIKVAEESGQSVEVRL